MEMVAGMSHERAIESSTGLGDAKENLYQNWLQKGDLVVDRNQGLEVAFELLRLSRAHGLHFASISAFPPS